MLPLTMEHYMENQMETDMGGCQDVGPFLGTQKFGAVLY